MKLIEMYIAVIKKYPVDVYSTLYAFFLLGIVKEKIENEFHDELDENYKKYSDIVDELYGDLLDKLKDIIGGIK